MDKGFFAYGSQIPSSGECIEEAIKKINERDKEIEIQSWKNLKVSGALIINRVLSAIDDADFFCADLTGLNDNVLFELGYALSKGKPLFLINDTSQIDSIRKYNELGLLNTIGYHSYTNTHHIVEGFFKERPYDPIDKYWEDLHKNLPAPHEKGAILVLNSQTETNYNLEIKNQLDFFKLPAIIDDASETIVQPINWYLQQLYSVPTVLVQFSSQTRAGYETHNSKCALISGIALGLGRKLQMIAEKPYGTPMDYRDLLKKFNNRPECQTIVRDYLKEVKRDIAELLLGMEDLRFESRAVNELQNINFGEAIAEHESTKLYEYFVDTHHSEELIKNEYNIIVGRKGTGKTATLYYLYQVLSNDKRNNVILIKPINFEVDGLIELMEESNSEFEKGFLIESIWKFLIYTEIANFLYKKIKSKPLYALNDEDKSFMDFIEENTGIYLTDFSTRLEEQIKALRNGNLEQIGAGNNNEFRLKVAELLQENSIKTMKNYFSKLFTRDQKIIVLIDNLDKSWKKDAKINILSKYLLGLLGVSGRIYKELTVIKATNTSLDFHLTIFLRSDIFKRIMAFAREPDKIEVSLLNWDDPEKLFRIIEDRFVNLSKGKYKTNDLWEKFFVSRVNGVDIKEFISASIFPRPRDIIYFFKISKDTAVSRGHAKVEEKDVLTAYKEYSSWVFKSVLVENGITYKQMEEFMYEMMAGDAVLSREEITKKMINSKIRTDVDDDVDNFIDHLVGLSVLGREVDKDEFIFEYDSENSKKNKILAQKYGSGRLKVHRALIPYLECLEK